MWNNFVTKRFFIIRYLRALYYSYLIDATDFDIPADESKIPASRNAAPTLMTKKKSAAGTR